MSSRLLAQPRPGRGEGRGHRHGARRYGSRRRSSSSAGSTTPRSTPGRAAATTLGPSQHTYDGADQALKVNLPALETAPPRTRRLPRARTPGGPVAVTTSSNTLTRDVPASRPVTVTAKAWYDIEAGYDYLYAQYSLDNGANWTTIGSPARRQQQAAAGSGLRYSYKRRRPALAVPLPLQDRRRLQPGRRLPRHIASRSQDLHRRRRDRRQRLDGRRAGRSRPARTSIDAPRYYLIENRQYVGYDETLAEGPYQLLRRHGAQQGGVLPLPGRHARLVGRPAYRRQQHRREHPGAGYALPVDATPNSFTYPDGTSPTNRREPFDATFGLDAIARASASTRRSPAARKKPTVTTLKACADGVPSRPRSTTPTRRPTTTPPQPAELGQGRRGRASRRRSRATTAVPHRQRGEPRQLTP